jgi:hypothetical protein
MPKAYNASTEITIDVNDCAVLKRENSTKYIPKVVWANAKRHAFEEQLALRI